MKETKYISVFPYNGNQYLHNIAFNSKKNRGIEASIFITLKRYLQERNIIICTYDTRTESAPFMYVYFDVPYPWNFNAWKMLLSNTNKNVLLCSESALIIPFNYMKLIHRCFIKVFTWYDKLIDNKKYFRWHFPKSSIGIGTTLKKFKNKKFLVLINKNTSAFYPFKILNTFGRELYSERIKAIEFFEHAIPDKFSLYGRGWNKPKKYNIIELLLGYKKYATYKGEIDNKVELLSNFKFCICFENLTGVNGYITEKIFDCFKAKCVPIYWGASDIQKYIPKNCFIDFRDFGDYDKLLGYLTSLDEQTYNGYIQNIQKLLTNKKFIDTWFEEAFAKFFLNDIVGTEAYEKAQ